MTVIVKVSDQPYLSLPEDLSRQLRLVDGDEVEVLQWGNVIAIRKHERSAPPSKLRALAGIVQSSRPRASVDVSPYMTRRGYEYLHVH